MIGDGKPGKTWTRHHYRVGVHLVWGTKHRAPTLAPELRWRLHRLLERICREKDCLPYAVGGWTDHVHVYVLLGAQTSVVSLVIALKANSSRWIRRYVPGLDRFEWGRGYAAIGVDPWRDTELRRYIATQEAHHGTNPRP